MSQSSHLNISYQKFLITDRQTATAFQATERRQFVFQQVNSQQSAVSTGLQCLMDTPVPESDTCGG